MTELVIKYHPDGRVEIEGVGFVGQECLQASLPFEKALGMEDVAREMKKDGPAAAWQGQQVRGRGEVSS